MLGGTTFGTAGYGFARLTAGGAIDTTFGTGGTTIVTGFTGVMASNEGGKGDITN